jgi:RNA-directed DNA polymerase
MPPVTKENMHRALKRVRADKGTAGVDGLDIIQTVEHLHTAWPAIREQLLHGTYRPSPVRRVLIPKPDGGQRELGIATVTDRLIQQALLQVLQPMIDPTFSEHSYGFWPGRPCARRGIGCPVVRAIRAKGGFKSEVQPIDYAGVAAP